MTESKPVLFHRIKGHASILSLLISKGRIFAGTQDGDLLVWSLETFELLATVHAHRSSLLSLCLSDDGQLLFSSAGDAIVNVWEVATLKRRFSIYSRYDVGDLFCVAYSSAIQCVYLGAQNTSIQWYNLSKKDSRPQPDPTAHPSNRNHRFFDSKGPTGISTPRPASSAGHHSDGGQVLEIDKDHILHFAHYGYVYCMLITSGLGGQGRGEEMLISGGGDGAINLWDIDAAKDGALTKISKLEHGDEPVLSLALDGTLLYSGRLEGAMNVWDLDTRQLIRTVRAHPTDVSTISIGHGLIFTGSAHQTAKIFNSHHVSVSEWNAHENLILASSVASLGDRDLLITGGNDGCINVWDISDSFDRPKKGHITSNEELVLALEKFVKYQTISGNTEYAHDCRRGASFLRALFMRFGAETELLSTNNERNPVVYARFRGSHRETPASGTILFYGHYDVVAVNSVSDGWNSDPFALQATNGYLYGRGVSDNKGPVLAAVYAAADAARAGSLRGDIVFIIEGEEESGSRGFEAAIRQNKELIGDVDWILLANSYWLTEDIPCLTYGLRGVIRATLEVKSERPDLHSGVDGSHLVSEAMKDLVSVLAKLSNNDGTVAIPHFYDNIPPITKKGNERYEAISRILLRQNPSLGDAESLKASFKARWREPSMTIHRVVNSGSASSSVMPRVARADISLRLVPNQTTREVESSLRKHVEDAFGQLESTNELTLSIEHKAEPWLGDPNNQLFQTLERAIMEAWAPVRPHISPLTSTSSIPQRKSPSTSATNGLVLRQQTGTKSPPVTSSTLSSPISPGALHDGVFDSLNTQSPASPGKSSSENVSPQHQNSSKGQLPGVAEQQRPLYIREGGSIPAIRFLETEFGAQAAHLPCGQASDKAHLDNERIRLMNLYKSREIFRTVFSTLGD